MELAPSKQPQSTVPQCGKCGIYRQPHCLSPKMKPSGKGRRKILVVGEAPGAVEDKLGIQFEGPSGQVLQRALEKFGVDLREDCWATNSITCCPSEDNSIPTPKVIEWCRPNLLNTIRELKPEVIVLLGAIAVKSLLGWLWKEDTGLVSRWDGWCIPSQRLNAWVCPTWHPAAMLHGNVDGKQKENEVRQLFFESHLKAACELEGRPWKEPPEFEDRVRIIYDPEEAVEWIEGAIVDNESVAFDYETTTLKPDSDKAEIVCCSISDGERSIVYPWHGAAIRATSKLLRSDIPKIGYSAKFEERHTWKALGHGVNNWIWDGMIAAHVLDNRPEITSLKFQAFVRLGVESWDDNIKPYLRSEGSNTSNRIREVDLSKIMFYCGLDSLYEWLVAEQQMKEMKNGIHHLSGESC